MNIIDAMKSGKTYRRCFSGGWYLPGCAYPNLSKEDILADDWEVEEERINLSWNDIAVSLLKEFDTTKGGLHSFISVEAFKVSLGFLK